MPKGAKRRAADAAADASAKKGRRASEADVALRLGDELGEHTVVSLANIILLKIAADMEGDNIDRMAVVKNFLCLFVALLFIAKTFTETLITGSPLSSSSKNSDDDDCLSLTDSEALFERLPLELLALAAHVRAALLRFLLLSLDQIVRFC